MPGVQEAAPEVALQTAPMCEVPAPGMQFEPVQQRLGSDELCGVHVRPGSQPPVVSHRQPWVPTMQVAETLPPGVPYADPPPELAPPPAPLDPPLDPFEPPLLEPPPPGEVVDDPPQA